MTPDNTDRPPVEPGAVASWFAEGVRSELAALEKNGGEQSYEVLSGKPVESLGPTQAIFQFIVADGTRIPEDATGKLKTATDEYAASVVGQQANRIHLRLEGKASMSSGIPRAMLIIDDTALLRRLAEILEETAATPTVVSLSATTVFHPDRAKVDSVRLPDTDTLFRIEGETRRIIERACGSTLTYI